MKKTFVTSMPNRIGAFLQASRCLARLGINITRVSYNKAVDSHTLFIDAEGSQQQLQQAEKELKAIGYLPDRPGQPSILLLEFRLEDRPGSVMAVLELIEQFHFNISYISSQENGSEYQFFKMGLLVEDMDQISDFLRRAEQICPVRVVEYDRTERVFDNSIFYTSFVSGLSQAIHATEEVQNRLLVNTNLAMQTLDEQGLSPYRVFDSISRFAELLSQCKGEAFSPRISRHRLSEQVELTLIEPPCGSNTAILHSAYQALFIDSGYACYQEEMLPIIRSILPQWEQMEKQILLTHADVDHCGLLPLFDKIIASPRSARCLQQEALEQDGFREENALHRPYIQICKALTGHPTVDPARIVTPWPEKELESCLQSIGFFRFGDMEFEVYEGRGGHLPGEIVLIDYAHAVAFTGDIYVNLQGMTSEQKQYNRYAPILMTSVDTDPALCAREREAIFRRLGSGKWQVFGSHGAKLDYQVAAG